MQREIGLGSVPAPGEPLQYEIDQKNQRLLDADIQARVERFRAKLTKRQYKNTIKAIKKLKKQLRSNGYRDLRQRRNVLKNRYLSFKEKSSIYRKRHKREIHKIIKAGKQIDKQLEAYQADVDRLRSLEAMIEAHNAVLAWEREDAENIKAFKREAYTWEQQLNTAFRQSPKLHHMGVDKNGKDYIDIPKIQRILIKSDKVYYLIRTSSQNPFERLFGRWHSELPYGVSVADMVHEETLNNLSAFTNRKVTVERSQKGTNLFYVISRLDSPSGIPAKVLYRSIFDYYPAEDHSKTPWAAGVTEDREIKWYNFEEYPHVLIAGATKGGKSNHVNQMIATMASMNTPAELRFILVDLKGGIEFTHWKGLKHQLTDMVTTPEGVLSSLQWLRSIMEKRLEAFERMKAKNLASFNSKVQKKLPRLLCVVDEMATLVGIDLTEEIHTELRVLSAQGRAVGIHLVLCTQHSSVDVLPGWVKTNMSLRVSAKMPSHQASMIILDSVTAATIDNIPGRMVFSSGRFETIAQSPYITDNEVETVVLDSSQYSVIDNQEFESSLPEPVEQFGRDNVLYYAIHEMKGKLSANRIHDIVGNEVIKLRELRAIVDSVKDEAEDGGIEYEGKLYKMIREGRAYVLVQWNDRTTEQNDTPSENQKNVPLNVPSQIAEAGD
jgi:hypothetical protein